MLAVKLKKTVALVGMMGAGKTAVGTALARKLGVPFRDSDAEIETAANRTIAEIFARDGEAFFRQKEAQVISRLLDDRPSILSTGGGAFLQDVNRENIHARGLSVWLDAPLSLLWQRVKHRDTRPLLKTADPYGTLAGLYESRGPVYALADVTVRSRPAFSVDDTAMAVIDALTARPDVLESK
ncbi:shikimate kinase [Tranquillimonas rosea]|uniref:shikimate kinase n=1 Tax=Tranquillimonas rosea TaxID=641238 RepID=UPI003BAB5293